MPESAFASSTHRGHRLLQRIDVPLLVGLVTLCMMSLIVLYSAGGENWTLLFKQLARVGLAFTAMLLVARFSPASYERWSPYIFTLGLSLLALVLAIGIVGKGAQRWLDLGIIRFQPAEIMKLAVPMMVAWILARGGLPPRYGYLAMALIAVGVPTAMVILQPDLGTGLLIAVSGIFVVLLSGIRWRDVFVVVGLATAAAPLGWKFLHEYQRQRILTLFDPWQDPLGSGYHTIQAIIAVGSGGPTGKGWLNGSQSQLDFIPERSTDFIFAVYAEEFGWYGALFILSVYVFVVLRGMMIAFAATDSYSRMLAGSLSLTFFIYVFVNVGMVSGMLPVVGVPLPLMSYGGTSMVTIMVAFGMLMSIHQVRPSLMKS